MREKCDARVERKFVLQRVRFRCSLPGVSAGKRPLGIGRPFRVSTRLGIALWVQRSHCAVGPFTSAVWYFFGGRRWSRLNFQPTPLFEFRLPPEYYPASPSRRAAARQLLSWTSSPYSTSGTEGPPHAGVACPLRSALRVWLPSRRFSPFDPAPVLSHTGCAPGIYPSEHSPPGKPPVRYRVGATHLPSPPASVTTYRSRRPGLAGRGFWAYLPESPWRPNVGLARQPLEAPLGFSLLGFALGSLDRDFARPPLTRFIASWSPTLRPASQSVDQPPPASARHPRASTSGRPEGPLEGFSTGTIPTFESAHVSGYLFHLTPRRALLPTGRRSWRRVPDPTEVVGTA